MLMKAIPRVTLAFCLSLVFSLAGCDEGGDSPTSPTPTTTIPPGVPTIGALVRVAHLTIDARIVDIVVNNIKVFRGLDYMDVTNFAELEPGEYRIQLVPEGQVSPAVAETTMTFSAGDTVTLALVGLESAQIVTIRDDLSEDPNRARVHFFNAVADFPDGFDLGVVNGQILFDDIDYLENSRYAQIIGGIYDLELKRAGTRERSAVSRENPLFQGGSYSVFAVGTLRRDDIEMVVVRDDVAAAVN
jgi:hypothetical protein